MSSEKQYGKPKVTPIIIVDGEGVKAHRRSVGELLEYPDGLLRIKLDMFPRMYLCARHPLTEETK